MIFLDFSLKMPWFWGVFFLLLGQPLWAQIGEEEKKLELLRRGVQVYKITSLQAVSGVLIKGKNLDLVLKKSADNDVWSTNKQWEIIQKNGKKTVQMLMPLGEEASSKGVKPTRIVHIPHHAYVTVLGEDVHVSIDDFHGALTVIGGRVRCHQSGGGLRRLTLTGGIVTCHAKDLSGDVTITAGQLLDSRLVFSGLQPLKKGLILPRGSKTTITAGEAELTMIYPPGTPVFYPKTAILPAKPVFNKGPRRAVVFVNAPAEKTKLTILWQENEGSLSNHMHS